MYTRRGTGECKNFVTCDFAKKKPTAIEKLVTKGVTCHATSKKIHPYVSSIPNMDDQKTTIGVPDGHRHGKRNVYKISVTHT